MASELKEIKHEALDSRWAALLLQYLVQYFQFFKLCLPFHSLFNAAF